MRKKTKALLLELPALIILIVIAIAPLFIKIFQPDILPMVWATPITLLLIVIAYFWGRNIERKETSHYY